MKITVIGCGRWGSFIAWYLDRAGHEITLYGRPGSEHFKKICATRTNGMVTFHDSVRFSTALQSAAGADAVVISIDSQGLPGLMAELAPLQLQNKIFVLCMKGLAADTGERLSETCRRSTDPSNRIAVWLGPGHVQAFTAGVPNCMVIDSADEDVKELLVREFSSDLIRFYYGTDLIGNEIGAAAKNVIGIAAGMLDGLGLTSLKGALMARGTREIAQLIAAMGGSERSAYGLCHLGDYEATVFSPYSHNRKYGELFVQGKKFAELAEGCFTVKALLVLGKKHGVELPICAAVDEVLYHGADARGTLYHLFDRTVKREF